MIRRTWSWRGRWTSATGHATGVAVVVCGAGLLVAAAVDLVAGDGAAAGLATVGAGAAVGGLLAARASALPAQAGAGPLLGTVVVVWVAMSAVSALAYLLTGTFTRIDDALFESVSGFTTTGLSVLHPLEGTPAGVLVWRAGTQWIGGFAAVVAAVAVLPLFGGGGLQLVESAAGWGAAGLGPRLRRAVPRLAAVYGSLTGALAAAYLLGGMTALDAVSYALTTASTGGFANHEASLGAFRSPLLEWLAVGGMLLAGANFGLYLPGLGARARRRSTELRAYLLLVATGSVLAVAWTAPDGGMSWDEVRHAVFSVAAVASTTGYTVTDWGGWAASAQVLLLVLMGVGAMSGSTGAGFRVFRLLVLVAYVRRELVRTLHPRAVRVVRLGAVPVPEDLLGRLLGYQVLYLLVAAGAAVALAALGADLVTAASAAVSSLSTVGPALGELGPGSEPLAVSAAARAVLMVAMLAGRLEIYPVLGGAAVLLGAAWRVAGRPGRSIRAAAAR